MDHTSSARNPISIAGALLTTLSALAFVIYYVSHALGFWISPYAGILGFIAIPAVFLVGLLLIPIGMWREGRRRRSGGAEWRWPVINLTSGRTRQVVFAVLVLTLLNVGIVILASVGAAHYMETNQFCGRVCHVPMRPEFVAHAAGAHARVSCVTCHVSPGAAGTLRAKRNGTRQLYHVVLGSFERPIPTPARGMPVAADTCARCHSAGHVRGDLTRVIRDYADDETSSETVTTLVVFPDRAHWHAREDLRIEYVATDEKRDTIPYVRVTEASGAMTEYFAEGTTARPAGELRRMHCIDCHSRPAHGLSASAERTVDRALASGMVSRSLPFVRRELVAALTATYPNEEAAVAEIASRLTRFYQGQGNADPAQLAAAIGTAQGLYRTNVFPEMHVTWGTHRNQLGHSGEVPGCFRCHDDEHKAPDGRLVRQDCELCHREQ